MSLIPRKISNFDEVLFQFIKGGEGHSRTVYADTKGIPTIGYGYAMVTSYYNTAEKRRMWKVRPGLEDQLKDSLNITLQQSDKDLLDNIVIALNDKSTPNDNISQAIALVGNTKADGNSNFNLTFPNGEAEGRKLYDYIINDYKNEVRKRIGDTLYNYLDGSNEMVALVSMAYNGPSLIDKDIVKALANGNRAETWFEIRYKSNTDNSKGAANRRYKEATMFNLYNSAFDEDVYKKEAISFQPSANSLKKLFELIANC